MSNKSTKKVNEDTGSVNIVDLFFYLLRYWYLFVICVLLCVGYASYKYLKSTLVFRSDATAIIKDPSSNRSTVKMESYFNMINRVNISNEILQFKSVDLMEKVVTRIEANISYTEHIKLRDVEIYKSSPVHIEFPDDMEEKGYARFVVTPVDEATVKLSIPGQKSVKVPVGKTLKTSFGSIKINPTENYNPFWYGKAVTVTWTRPINAAKGFSSRLKITQANSNASILNFSVQDYSRERASAILNTLIDIYNEEAINEKNQVAINTSEFINDRLEIIEMELGDVEGALAAYKSKHQIMSVGETASRYLEQNRSANAEVANLETRLRLANYIKEYITNSENSESLLPINTGLDDSRVEGLIAQYNAMKLRQDKLKSDSSAENPVVVELEASLASLKQTIIESINNLIISFQVKKNDALKLESTSIANFASMPSRAREVLSIERQQKIKEQLYLYLLNKREENALSQAMVDNNARIINKAESTFNPVAPNRNKMLMLAFLIGLAAPAAVLIGRLLLDNTIHSRKDVEDVVSAPFLGTIPKSKEAKKLKKDIIYDKASKGIFTESFRMLCTNIDFMRQGEAPEASSVLSFSSFTAASGKTFAALNMAACLADAGKKVVLVDLDLRKRSISDRLGHKHHTRGVSNFIFDSSLPIKNVIIKDVIEGVDLVPAGQMPPNPVELLKRKRLDELISELRKEYDYILMDCVPVDVVADAVIVDRLCDVNIFILRAGMVDRRMLPALETIYQSEKLHNLGIVLNGADVAGSYSKYGYGYGYGYYGYGYGYGYGETEDRNGHKALDIKKYFHKS